MTHSSSRENQSSPVGTAGPEPESAEDLVWGVHPVQEALEKDPTTIREITVQQGKTGYRLQRLIDLARDQGVLVRFASADRLGVPRHCRHQGVVARLNAVRVFPFSHLLERLADHSQEKPRTVLALDSLQDPRNLGSILRSALAAGFSDVLMTRERSVPLTGTVVRASAGAVAHLHLYQVGNLVDALDSLKKHGYWIYGTVTEQSAASIYTVDFSGPICVVIGSEGKGLRPLVRKQSDFLVTIPMQAAFNSLNVSVAAAIVMFEIVRRYPE
ncbi:MAG: 23S rRNA (guanosine(2251)-2'-O)-methyltransferase RlmB [Desulfobulbus oligotrophicus]|jgi:23S rRNA (guanosine2251-2'-O)-methyltransferase|nr:23S rRNA (guanosine(2251)-2'-O)-methyltransferase RlmB [Desulfobulbus oligotrophicus]